MSQLLTLPGWARRRPHLFLLLWMGISVVAVIGMGGYYLLNERQRLIERSEALAENYAGTIARRIEASVAKVDVLLSLIAKDRALRDTPGRTQALGELFEQALENHPELMSVMVIDADGYLTGYSRPRPEAATRFSDRDYFLYHQTHTGQQLHISAPIKNRFNGRMTVPLTMRLEDRRGAFAGVAFIGLSVDYFDQEFARISLGRQPTIAVSDRAATILFRHPAVDGAIGSNIGHWQVFREWVLKAEHGVGESICPVDQVARVHAFRHLQRYPLVTFSGIAMSEIDAQWRESLKVKVPLLLAMLLVLVGSGWLMYRQLLHDARVRLRLKASLRRASEANERARTLNEALQKSGDFQQAVLHSTGCGIIATDVRGEVLFMNKASTKILGFTADEVVRKMSPLVFHRTEDVREALQRIRIGDTPYLLMVAHINAHPGREWQFVRKDGTPVAVSLSITALKARDGLLDGYVTIFHDLTELNRLEGLKSDFVSVVSHELRTPVTAIRGALSLHQAAAGSDLAPSQQRLLSIAIDNCDKLVRIVSDILDIDKLASNKLRLNRSIESVGELIRLAITQTQPFATQYGVTFRMAGDPDLLRLSLDADRFNQIMVNLLSNAAKFSHPNSEVTVSAREELGYAVVRVADYGIGIPESFQPHIFERFSQYSAALTRKSGGTGLGLAITKMLVDAHGGTIGFHSEQGMGTTFTLSFPLGAGMRGSEHQVQSGEA